MWYLICVGIILALYLFYIFWLEFCHEDIYLKEWTIQPNGDWTFISGVLIARNTTDRKFQRVHYGRPGNLDYMHVRCPAAGTGKKIEVPFHIKTYTDGHTVSIVRIQEDS